MSSQNLTFSEFIPSHPRVVEAIALAWNVRSLAHVEHSGFRVGAALYVADRDILVPGVNVENVSYGGTICAERSAFVSAISTYGVSSFGFIAVATKADPPASPCGICLQFMVEFCPPEFPIFLVNESGLYSAGVLGDFLPLAFRSFKK